jgi:outer membrane receptor protein involved in Fe transport
LTGSQAINPYATLSAYNTGAYYSFSTGIRTNGIQVGSPSNSDLKWETTEQKDFGIEMGFFNNRLSFEFDYFTKHTRDLLLNKSVPFYAGGGSIVSNVGDIENKGIEVNVTAHIISTKDWGWESVFNFSSVKNKVTNLGDETRIFDTADVTGLNGQPAFVYEVGQSLGSLWGLKYLGPWQKDEAGEAAKFGSVPGDAHYEDLDGNYSIDGSDYQIIGCGMPKYSLGWNNTVTYKNFTLNAFFQGSFGADKLNFTRGLHLMGDRDARQATLAEIKERYIPGVNENAWLPAWGTSSKWDTQSTMFLENANYLRLKNISISYDFKVKKLADFRVSLSAINLFTLTSYKGIDPESSNVGGSGSDIQQGIDYGSYPNSKTYTIGLNITF